MEGDFNKISKLTVSSMIPQVFEHACGGGVMLVKLNEWRKTRFPQGQAPDVRVCRREIDLGTLPGKRIGRSYYVDVDREKTSTGDDLLDDLLSH